MNVITRGIRNAFRNSIRTFSIVIILGISVGLTLSMLAARQAVAQKIAAVKSSIGNTITVSPAGVQGFQGGGDLLTTDELSKINNLPNVTHVTETLSDRLTTDNTSLASAIDAGSFGNRQAGNSGVGFRFNGGFGGGDGQVIRTFTPPVVVTGTNDVSAKNVFGGNAVTYTNGQAIDPTKDVNEAIVGKSLARKNNLNVGSTFTAYGQTIKVDGIYDTGNTFANAEFVMALPAVERLSSQAGQVSNAIVTVNSIDNLSTATSAIKNVLGDKADVTSNQDTASQVVAPLENVKTISLYSLIGALGAGAIIILLTMMMIVRERRREIGVLKAIGSSNVKTVLQFVSEALTLTVLGLIVGLIIGLTAATPITRVLVNNSTSSASQVVPGPSGFGRGRGGLRALTNNGVTNIRNIEASTGWSLLAYGVASAFAIAIIGSAIPALFISKVRPADVMRAE